jgi:hypothetical protein
MSRPSEDNAVRRGRCFGRKLVATLWRQFGAVIVHFERAGRLFEMICDPMIDNQVLLRCDGETNSQPKSVTVATSQPFRSHLPVTPSSLSQMGIGP